MKITPEMRKIAADGKMIADKLKEPEMHSNVQRWEDSLKDIRAYTPNPHRAPSSSRILGMLDEK
jgi:hypothetical protein